DTAAVRALSCNRRPRLLREGARFHRDSGTECGRMIDETTNFSSLPGGDLVERGLRELRAGQRTESGLLVLIASPRLMALGIDVPARHDILRPYEHRLYELLDDTHGAGAYSRYNSLIRRIVSFSHLLGRVLADAGP